MRCPRCGFVDPQLHDKCPRCAYLYTSQTSGRLPQLVKPTGISETVPSPHWSSMRGDVLSQGRYRLIEEAKLPKNQQNQGDSWFALDMQANRRRVLLRKLLFPNLPPEKVQQAVNSIVKRMEVISRHQGLSNIIDVFQDQGAYYVVQMYPIGESLASLMQRQGGALPERDIAEYGRQLCEILTILAQQQPPIIHGSINTETIIISSNRGFASLIYLPLLPQVIPQHATSATSYLAPEQARGGEVQPSSDLYSLAATMHHAVTGFDPRERMVFFYPPARRLNPLVSTAMEAILTQQLRFSISQRYAGPEHMQKDLATLIASYPPLDQTPAPTQISSSLQFSQSLLTTPQKKLILTPRNITITTISTVVLMFLLAGLISFASNRASTMNSANAAATSIAQITLYQTALNKQTTLELQSFKKKGIGLSDGRLVFDTYQGRTDTNLKEQAATALQQGNTSAAVNLLNQAVSADPADGEAQIYNEDIHLLQDKSSYITLALGMPIDVSATHLGSDREQLEAVYLTQHETNSKNLLPNGLKLRIIIANSGANNADVATVAQFIANRVSQSGNLDHLIGVVGWYNSTQTINARDIIASVHLPLIAPTASSIKLSGSSPYFFRVAPPDDLQGQILGTLLVNKLKVKRVLILNDATDSYSVSLSNAVANRVQALGGTFTVGKFTENTTAVDQYQQIVENNAASAMPAEAIFLAGINVDGIRLAHAVGNAARADPLNIQLRHLKVVGGDAIDSRLLLGEGNNADAQIASTFPQDMRLIIFTTFADFNQWNFLQVPQVKQPTFFSDWKSTYQSSIVSNSAPNPAYKGLMIYDAVGVFLYAAKLIHGPIVGDNMRNALNTIGKGNIPAYQGVSGRIMFDNQGNPVNKAVVILSVRADGLGNNNIVIQQILGDFS